MKKLLNQLSALRIMRDERGLSTVEYVVLLVLIVIMAVAVWNAFGGMITEKLETSGQRFDDTVVSNGNVEEEELEATGADWAGMQTTISD